PPEFLQWPQSVSKAVGSSAVFTCQAQGVPEPHLIWLKNGKILTPRGNVKLTNNNSTLAVTRITAQDEAIYQCIAENSAGTNQASARLAVSRSADLPEAPQDLTATPLSTTSLLIRWNRPEPHVSDRIIGYVLHIRKLGDPDSGELQEAVTKDTFQHEFNNLETATTFSIYVKAYSPQGASQQSPIIITTTLGGVPSMPSFFTKVLNSTAMQVFWDLPSKAGRVEGYKLSHRMITQQETTTEERFPSHINTHTISNLEPAAVYEIQLTAFNGNGDSISNKRLVSLAETEKSRKDTAGESLCDCRQDSDSPVTGIVVGIHIGVACIIFCALFLMFGYRHSFFRHKGSLGSWSLSGGQTDSHRRSTTKETTVCTTDAIELMTQGVSAGHQAGDSQCRVMIEPHCPAGTSTGVSNGTG
ncbi:putative immunoglobulin superfamily DCC subclass member 3-like, partial [Triplophysa rosa]